MARKGDSIRNINVAVVGLSGVEKDKGHAGVGKSCLCNRFMRPHAEDYNVDHISVLSQTDFSGRVVNNDHFLYWGEVIKTSDEGNDYQFSVIEQTEFIDDSSFQPFKGGKMEAYVKRCSATKITSAEKLMYICKNQLGIEKEYEQKTLPDGRLSIDGFICVFDVSIVPGRNVEKQIDFVTAIINNILKSKKPVVFVTTKNDDSNDILVREAQKVVQRSEYKGSIPIIESSAHDNINIDIPFVILGQIIDKSKVRSKILTYQEASMCRKEILDAASDAFMRLIRIHVTDCHALWSQTVKKLNNHKEWVNFVQLFGLDGTQRLFRRHIKKLKDEQLAKQIARYMDMLPDVLNELIPCFNTLTDSDWGKIQSYIKQHPQFSTYFYEKPEDIHWSECLEEDNDETRIPFDVLDTNDAENVFKNHLNVLQKEQKRMEYKKQFKQLLEDTGYVTPGKYLSEVRVLFMGRECFESLSEHDCQNIYEVHQRELIETAKNNFQELLLEHADLFYHFKNIAPTGTITQEDIKEITDVLQEDFRYKILDRLEQDRKLILFQHLGFIHYPIKEHCPALPDCMDILIERILTSKTHRITSWSQSSQWMLNSDTNQLNLLILGFEDLADNLAGKIRSKCDDDEYEMDGQFYSLDYRIISGDVSLPHNSFRTSDFTPNGSFCVYSNYESFEYIRESLEKKLLSNLEQDDKLPFQGLPIVLLFIQDSFLDEKEILKLKEEGQNLADSLQCPFMDVSLDKITEEQLVFDALTQLIKCIQHRSGFLNLNVNHQTVIECTEPDIRIIMCLFCGDPYQIENILGPLLSHQMCFLSSSHSIVLETFLGDSKKKVEVIVSSFHGANAFRDELVHGFILVYSAKRKASLATLNAFSMNIPNLPIQILAVTETGSANSFFNDDLSQLLISEGNATADRLQAHFMTSTANMQQKTAFFTPFFKEVWDKKPEIEQAFNMDESLGLDSGEGTLERSRIGPVPPQRNESYYLKLNDESESENFELSSSDHSDKFSNVYMYSDSKKRQNSHHGFQVYPPPNTPPEPAPPDNLTNTRHHSKKSLLSSQTSLEEMNYEAAYNYQHAFTTGRTKSSSASSKSRICQTLKQPGRLNMKNYSAVTDAIAKMNLNAPLATPESIDLGSDYAQVKDLVHMYPETDYMYTMVHDALRGKAKTRQRREKGQPSYSDTDSEWSSLERRQRASEIYSKMNKKGQTHKRQRKKRTAIPVQPPRVPQLNSFTLPNSSLDLDTSNVVEESNSDSESISEAEPFAMTNPQEIRLRFQQKQSRSLSLKKRVPDIHSMGMNSLDMFPNSAQFDDSSLDISSPRDNNSPMLFGLLPKDSEKLLKKREKQKAKDDSKLEKRRLKEEKLRRLAEERERKRLQKAKHKNLAAASSQSLCKLADFIQNDKNLVPVFMEKCVRFIESEGLDSEGIYRVPGNRAHVDLLFQKFDEDSNIDIQTLDIPVNAVATALKDFVSKKLPPLFESEVMAEIEDITGNRIKSMIGNLELKNDRSCRLLALRSMLDKLPAINFAILKFIFQHFVRVTENSKLNSMDSKNLAICWWPTLLPIEFSDMGRFEQMRPYLEDIVQTMIDQYPFLFCGKEAFVMV